MGNGKHRCEAGKSRRLLAGQRCRPQHALQGPAGTGKASTFRDARAALHGCRACAHLQALRLWQLAQLRQWHLQLSPHPLHLRGQAGGRRPARKESGELARCKMRTLPRQQHKFPAGNMMYVTKLAAGWRQAAC